MLCIVYSECPARKVSVTLNRTDVTLMLINFVCDLAVSRVLSSAAQLTPAPSVRRTVAALSESLIWHNVTIPDTDINIRCGGRDLPSSGHISQCSPPQQAIRIWALQHCNPALWSWEVKIKRRWRTFNVWWDEPLSKVKLFIKELATERLEHLYYNAILFVFLLSLIFRAWTKSGTSSSSLNLPDLISRISDTKRTNVQLFPSCSSA